VNKKGVIMRPINYSDELETKQYVE
jgi:hypothetical protein